MKLLATVVDDERPAVEELTELLAELPQLGSIQSFTTARKALQHMAKSAPDVAFLDIQMPGMTGVQLAEQLLQVAPQTEVVFVTAYEQYAVAAFELSAADYLLKPVAPERLRMTIDRIMQRRQAAFAYEPVAQPLRLSCFGTLRLESAAGAAVKWRTVKVRELFAYLYIYKEVSPDRLVDDLFPESPSEKARAYIHTCIYQLRKALAQAGMGEQIVIALDQRKYSLRMQNVISDMEQFAQVAAMEQMHEPQMREAVLLCEGELFDGLDSLWLTEHRERFRQHYLRMVLYLYDAAVAGGQHRQALDYAHQIYRQDMWDERAGLRMIESYLRLGQQQQAHDFLTQFREQYEAELNTALPRPVLQRCQELLARTPADGGV